MLVNSPFIDVQTALEEMRAGRMVVVVDDEDRENEGDLTMAAENITPEAVNFMAKFGRGLICLALTPERIDDLGLQPMTRHNTARLGTAFTESIDALSRGVTTGISAYDRSQTILCAIDPNTHPAELGRPGHIFPLRAQQGGVLVRPGQTEAAVDLTRLAGLKPAGVICEIMNDDGTMARVPDLVQFCEQHSMKMMTVADLIRYRMDRERCVFRTGVDVVPTEFGSFSMISYGSELDEDFHIALVYGNPGGSERPALVRLHGSFAPGEVFSAPDCDAAFRASLQRISEEGSGALVCLRHRSPWLPLKESDGTNILASGHGEKEPSMVEPVAFQQSDLVLGAAILRDLNLRLIRLLTNHSSRTAVLQACGIEVVETVSISAPRTHAVAWAEETLIAAG